MTRKTDIRRRELAAIHSAKRELGLDDETYRAMLQKVAGVRSAADLDIDGRQSVLTHLKASGWQGVPRKRVAQHPGRPHNLDREPLLQKIEAQLADMGAPWGYADSIAKRQTGIAKVAWLRSLDQLRGVVAALAKEQKKRALAQELEERAAHSSTTPEALMEHYGFVALRNWRRNAALMQAVLASHAEAVDSAASNQAEGA